MDNTGNVEQNFVHVVQDGPKNEQEKKYKILKLEKSVKNSKIATAVLAGATIVGTVASAALGIRGGAPEEAAALAGTILGGGLKLTTGAFIYNRIQKNRLSSLIESINNKQSLNEFAAARAK